jgi:phosphoribosyl 1,2-cyclic phosphate phosphodiesterase
MLRTPWFGKIDGVLITHEHYDHVGGLDDLRPFCRRDIEVPIYAEDYTCDHLRARMPYCFQENRYPGTPQISLHTVEPLTPFRIGEVPVVPFRVMHGKMPILGYRIGEHIGYITDMLTMPEESYEQLHGLDILVVNALRDKPHAAHQTIAQAIETATRIGARETYFVHLTHTAGLHVDLEKRMPPHIHIAYDGLEVPV